MTLEEIVVTAEKRETTLQETPLAIAAIDQDKLLEAGIREMKNIGKVVPDVNVFQSGSLSVISIRGVRQGNFGPDTETVTAVHLDGAVLARPTSLTNHFYDLERVEVLKGPQGTLYGRGATGGAINIITKRPELREFGGYAEAEAGNFDYSRFEGALNVPIGDRWAARLTGRQTKRDGTFRDTGFLGDLDDLALRGQVLGELTEKATLRVTADIQEHEGLADVFTPPQPVGGFGSYVLTNIEEPWRNAATWGVAEPFADVQTKNWGAMAQLDYDLGFATLTTQYAHRDAHEETVGLFGAIPFLVTGAPPGVPTNSARLATFVDLLALQGLPPAAALLQSETQSNSESVEIRLASSGSGPLEWVGGLFYFDESTEIKTSSSGFVNTWRKPLETVSQAVFGQLTYSPINSLHLTAGARYNKDEKDTLQTEGTPLRDPDVAGSRIKADWSKVTWKANISYDLTPDNMIYGQVSTGMKAGYIATNGNIVEPEELTAYEIGSKNRFFDSRLQVNAEVYYYDYPVYNSFVNTQICRAVVPNTTDQCVNVGGGPGIDPQIDTVAASTTIAPGGARQYGGSLDVVWLMTAYDRVTANLAYQYNEFKSYDMRAAILQQFPSAQFITPAQDMSDLQWESGIGIAANGQPWRGSVGYMHTFDVGVGTLDAGVDAYYEGDHIDVIMRRNEPQEYTLPGLGDYWIADASITFRAASESWHVRGYVRNLFDSDHLAYITYTDLGTNGRPISPSPQSGYTTGGYIEPRTYGISANVRF